MSGIRSWAAILFLVRSFKAVSGFRSWLLWKSVLEPQDVACGLPLVGARIMDADAVVVGSGAGGGIAAAALADVGRSVIVLEAGPFADERTMPMNELDAFDRHYLNHGLLATWDGSITMLSGSGVGGGTLVFSLVVALAAAAFGWARRRELGVVLLVGFGPAAVVLVGELARQAA